MSGKAAEVSVQGSIDRGQEANRPEQTVPSAFRPLAVVAPMTWPDRFRLVAHLEARGGAIESQMVTGANARRSRGAQAGVVEAEGVVAGDLARGRGHAVEPHRVVA